MQCKLTVNVSHFLATKKRYCFLVLFFCSIFNSFYSHFMYKFFILTVTVAILSLSAYCQSKPCDEEVSKLCTKFCTKTIKAKGKVICHNERSFVGCKIEVGGGVLDDLPCGLNIRRQCLAAFGDLTFTQCICPKGEAGTCGVKE